MSAAEQVLNLDQEAAVQEVQGQEVARLPINDKYLRVNIHSNWEILKTNDDDNSYNKSIFSSVFQIVNIPKK